MTAKTHTSNSNWRTPKAGELAKTRLKNIYTSDSRRAFLPSNMSSKKIVGADYKQTTNMTSMVAEPTKRHSRPRIANRDTCNKINSRPEAMRASKEMTNRIRHEHKNRQTDRCIVFGLSKIDKEKFAHTYKWLEDIHRQKPQIITDPFSR